MHICDDPVLMHTSEIPMAKFADPVELLEISVQFIYVFGVSRTEQHGAFYD